MIFVLILVALLPLSCRVESLLVTNCSHGSAGAELTSINYTGCKDDSERQCNLIKGTNASVEIGLKVLRPFSSARLKIVAILDKNFIPLQLVDEPACRPGQFNLECPAEIGYFRKLLITEPILWTFPNVECKLQLFLVDQNDETLICVEVPIKVMDGEQ